jgi:hypothetical protein
MPACVRWRTDAAVPQADASIFGCRGSTVTRQQLVGKLMRLRVELACAKAALSPRDHVERLLDELSTTRREIGLADRLCNSDEETGDSGFGVLS